MFAFSGIYPVILNTHGSALSFASQTSFYQHLKLVLVSLLNAEAKDVFHVYVGFIALFLSTTLLRRPINSYSAILPGLIVACLLEVLDLKDDYLSLGYLRWGASLRDVVNTNLLPFLLIVLFRWGKIKVLPKARAGSGNLKEE